MVIPWICFAKSSINWRRNLNNDGSRWKKLSKKSSREKMEIGCSGICRILSGLSLIISMTVWERRKTFNTVTEHKTTGNTKPHIQRFELIRPGQFYFDACYNPPKTAFLKNAEKKGCKILNGLGMSRSRGLLRSNYGPDRRLHWMWCEKNERRLSGKKMRRRRRNDSVIPSLHGR